MIKLTSGLLIFFNYCLVLFQIQLIRQRMNADTFIGQLLRSPNKFPQVQNDQLLLPNNPISGSLSKIVKQGVIRNKIIEIKLLRLSRLINKQLQSELLELVYCE